MNRSKSIYVLFLFTLSLSIFALISTGVPRLRGDVLEYEQEDLGADDGKLHIEPLDEQEDLGADDGKRHIEPLEILEENDPNHQDHRHVTPRRKECCHKNKWSEEKEHKHRHGCGCKRSRTEETEKSPAEEHSRPHEDPVESASEEYSRSEDEQGSNGHPKPKEKTKSEECPEKTKEPSKSRTRTETKTTEHKPCEHKPCCPYTSCEWRTESTDCEREPFCCRDICRKFEARLQRIHKIIIDRIMAAIAYLQATCSGTPRCDMLISMLRMFGLIFEQLYRCILFHFRCMCCVLVRLCEKLSCKHKDRRCCLSKPTFDHLIKRPCVKRHIEKCLRVLLQGLDDGLQAVEIALRVHQSVSEIHNIMNLYRTVKTSLEMLFDEVKIQFRKFYECIKCGNCCRHKKENKEIFYIIEKYIREEFERARERCSHCGLCNCFELSRELEIFFNREEAGYIFGGRTLESLQSASATELERIRSSSLELYNGLQAVMEHLTCCYDPCGSSIPLSRSFGELIRAESLFSSQLVTGLTTSPNAFTNIADAVRLITQYFPEYIQYLSCGIKLQKARIEAALEILPNQQSADIIRRLICGLYETLNLQLMGLVWELSILTLNLQASSTVADMNAAITTLATKISMSLTSLDAARAKYVTQVTPLLPNPSSPGAKAILNPLANIPTANPPTATSYPEEQIIYTVYTMLLTNGAVDISATTDAAIGTWLSSPQLAAIIALFPIFSAAQRAEFIVILKAELIRIIQCLRNRLAGESEDNKALILATSELVGEAISYAGVAGTLEYIELVKRALCWLRYRLGIDDPCLEFRLCWCIGIIPGRLEEQISAFSDSYIALYWDQSTADMLITQYNAGAFANILSTYANELANELRSKSSSDFSIAAIAKLVVRFVEKMDQLAPNAAVKTWFESTLLAQLVAGKATGITDPLATAIDFYLRSGSKEPAPRPVEEWCAGKDVIGSSEH